MIKFLFYDTGTVKEEMTAKRQADGSDHIHVLLIFYDGDKKTVGHSAQQPS